MSCEDHDPLPVCVSCCCQACMTAPCQCAATEYDPNLKGCEFIAPFIWGDSAKCAPTRRPIEDIARELVANYGEHGLVEELERRIVDALDAERKAD